MEAIYRKIMTTTKNYKTYKQIPEAIVNQENFVGNSVQGVKEDDWYYVYSYGTLMAIVLANDAGVVLNKHKYSRTTSKIQAILRRLFEDATVYEVYPAGETMYRDNKAMHEKAEDAAIADA